MKFVKSIIAGGVLFAASTTSWAYMINDGGTYNGQEVGVLDSLVNQTTSLSSGTVLGGTASCGSGSSATNEECWVESVLGFDVDYTKQDSQTTVYKTDASTTSVDALAFELPAISDYFLIKNRSAWALFENNADKSWAHFLNNSSLDVRVGGDLTISHFGYTGSTDIPEPGVLGLLGIGLIGLGLQRKKQR